jgi:hypothetical protein
MAGRSLAAPAPGGILGAGPRYSERCAGAARPAIERIVAASVYQAVKEAMQDLIAPELAAVRGEIAGLRGEMHGVRGELDGLRAEMRAEINGLRAEMSANMARLDERLTIALDLRERIVALEAKLRN